MAPIDFKTLISTIKKFQLSCAPARESDIESALIAFLKMQGYSPKQQQVIREGRLDIVVGPFIIEVKKHGQKNIAEQLDRYSTFCEGLIVVCWKASLPLKQIFAMEKRTARIPVELIEVRACCELI